MHCDDAGCVKICPAEGALFKTKQGAVAYNKDKCIGCKLCVAGCPFNIPRYDEKDKISNRMGKEETCKMGPEDGILRVVNEREY
jgi:Fe-S-cluster-containing dehydrogenase component